MPGCAPSNELTCGASIKSVLHQRVERTDLEAERLHGGHDRNRDAGGDHGIFDRRGA